MPTVERGKVVENKYDDIANGLHRIADGINPPGTEQGNDAYGGVIRSLIEAVMGIPYGLKDVADAIREHGNDIQTAATELAPEETTTSASGGSEVCRQCGANREIWTDLDLREKLGGIKGKNVSHYTTQKWRTDGSGPPYFLVAGRICHYRDEVFGWLETKRQNSTSSANATSEIEVDEPNERGDGEDAS